MTEFDLGPGLRLEERITASEGEGIHARWEYGRWLLAKRKGKQLPNGLLDQLVAVTDKSRTELKYRAQFAERYPTEDEVANALATNSSWRDIVNSLSRRYDKRCKEEEKQLPVKSNRSPSPFDHNNGRVPFCMFRSQPELGTAYYENGKVWFRKNNSRARHRPTTWSILEGVEALFVSAREGYTPEVAADITKTPANKKTFLKVIDQAQHELDALKRLLN